MSDVPAEWIFLSTGWRLALILTGSQKGASRAFRDTVAEVSRHPNAGDHHRLEILFFSALRRRCLRVPASNTLSGLVSALHQQPEPGRSTLALTWLNALPASELHRVVEVDGHPLSSALEKTREQLQPATDAEGATAVSAIELSTQATTDISDAAHTFSQRHEGSRISIRNPATLAVALGFLLLVGVLTWHFLGQAGIFPEEAIKIATVGSAARPDQFDPIEEKAGQLQDWFMLKGFDNFRVPPGFENFDVIGVRIFKSDNEPIAQAAVAENTMFFYSFASQDLGIDIRPEKSWRVTQADNIAIAIREERGVCFMISFRGTEEEMQKFLRKAGQ